MSNNHSKRRLGRGLAALIGEVNQPTDSYEKKQKNLLNIKIIYLFTL